jgi:hypothetical protein
MPANAISSRYGHTCCGVGSITTSACRWWQQKRTASMEVYGLELTKYVSGVGTADHSVIPAATALNIQPHLL